MSPQASWILSEEIVPRLRGAVPRSVRQVGVEDAEELVQDATVMAAKMLNRVDEQGKLGKVGASNIAYYTIQHMKSGRRSGGASTVDVLGTGTQLNCASKLHSLHEVVCEFEGDEIFELHDIISNDHEDPATIAARKMDWEYFMTGLTRLEKRLVECLISGKTVREICRAVKMTKLKLIELQRKIAMKILEFMGADILVEIARMPRWKINLDAERESVLCRHERRALA